MIYLRQSLPICLILCLVRMSYAWSNHVGFNSFRSKRTVISMKRGRGSLGKEIGFDDNGQIADDTGRGGTNRGLGSSSASSSNRVINWIPIPVSVKDLPADENKVGVIDTNLPTMKVSQTNPTGAVSVLKYGDQTYCFAVNCPSCKIPLTKAKAVAGDTTSDGYPRLVCDLCKGTYNLKSGAKLKSAVDNPGFLGGIAKSVFSSKDSGNLKTYQLGEKNGKILIALD